MMDLRDLMNMRDFMFLLMLPQDVGRWRMKLKVESLTLNDLEKVDNLTLHDLARIHTHVS